MIVNAQRLRLMTPDELAWRTRGLVRTQAQRTLARVRRPIWDRRALGSALAAGSIEPPLRRAIEAENWAAAHGALEEQLRRRPSRFLLDPATAGTLTSQIHRRWPDAATDAAARADRLLAGSHDLLGYHDLRFSSADGSIDWHLDPVHGRRAPSLFWADVPFLDPACGDHKIIWELNRQQHVLQLGRALWLTGDARYGEAIVDRLEQWLDANPPLAGINWASMLEIALRSLSWTWALHFLSGAGPSTPLRAGVGLGSERAPWLVDLIVGLDRQLAHVEQNLSYYFSPNTHLTGEALALYVTGLAMPELAGSPRWVALGRGILQREIGRQIHPDGGHAEASTHYQRYTLDMYLCALLSATRAGDAEGVASFGEVVPRLADFTRTMADDEGVLPLIGDDDGGMLWPIAGRACRDVRDSLALAASLLNRPDLAPWGMQEEVLWVGGAALAESLEAAGTQAAGVPSRAFRDTGYIVARGGDGSHAVFDAGRHGYQNCGHAHADALAVTLNLEGRPLLVDPGTATYMDNRVRDEMRATRSHNTVTIDERPQSVPAGRFHWTTRTDAELHAWRSTPSFDWAEASHDGYAPIRHRRTMIRTEDAGWLFVDEILGDGSHEAEASWHFDPAWTVAVDAHGVIRATDAAGHAAWLLHDTGSAHVERGGEDGSGWFAPVYGVRVPAAVVRVRSKAVGPFSMLTWVGADRRARPQLERVSCISEAGGDAVAARVSNGDRASVFMIRPGPSTSSGRPRASSRDGEPEARDGRDARLPDFRTDARVLHYTTSGGTLRTLDLVDATRAVAIHDGWLSVTADARIPDLHVTIHDHTIDVQSSDPPASLTIDGDALLERRIIRVNGRESRVCAPLSY